MTMLCLFHRSSMCRPGHCALMRSELLDLTTIISATACHQSNYVEPYSRFKEQSLTEAFPFGQKTQMHHFHRVYEPTFAHSTSCIPSGYVPYSPPLRDN